LSGGVELMLRYVEIASERAKAIAEHPLEFFRGEDIFQGIEGTEELKAQFEELKAAVKTAFDEVYASTRKMYGGINDAADETKKAGGKIVDTMGDIAEQTQKAIDAITAFNNAIANI